MFVALLHPGKFQDLSRRDAMMRFPIVDMMSRGRPRIVKSETQLRSRPSRDVENFFCVKEKKFIEKFEKCDIYHN